MSDAVTRLNSALEGRYAIERELGEGGMATVYLADDLKHERKVALKVLNPNWLRWSAPARDSIIFFRDLFKGDRDMDSRRRPSAPKTRLCGRFTHFFALMAVAVAACQPAAVQVVQERDIFVPNTISPEAQQVLRGLIQARPYTREVPAADDLDAWRQTHAAMEAAAENNVEQAIASQRVTVTEAELGGVPVLDVRPDDWINNGKVLVYTHGGAYTLFSARSTLGSSAKMSRATGLRVISVDYTTAPFATWSVIQDQAVSVFRALLAEGYAMEDIALYGDSAGGGLAVSTVLNLRDLGLGLPAAVVLWSPWVDISDAGDTAYTLEGADPTLDYESLLYQSALAFTGGLDLTDPSVSPIHADFDAGFSPALIQAGTKEILLSTAVRLFQRLEGAGQDATLDVYEGMWHVFQQHSIPEAELAVRKSADFINAHLR